MNLPIEHRLAHGSELVGGIEMAIARNNFTCRPIPRTDVITVFLFSGTAGEVDEIAVNPTAARDHNCAVIAMC